MDDFLTAAAARQGGVFSRGQAVLAGYSDEAIRRLLRTDDWLRVRRGVFASRADFTALDDRGKHTMRTHAVMLALGYRGVVSHSSAAVLYDLPLWNLDLSLVHVTRAKVGGGRVEAGIYHHRALTPPDDVDHVDGLPVSSTARAIIETASLVPYETATVLADAALHRRLVDRHALWAALQTMQTWPGARRATSVVEFADGGAESPGESRTRMLLHRAGLPTPRSQVDIFDPSGGHVGRVDFLLAEHDVIVEFDGKVKYEQGDAEELFREKRREDRLRELGYEVVRITWADLDDPHRVVALIRAAMTRSSRRRARRTA